MHVSGGTVLVIGSLNVDLIARTPRLPAPGETVIGGTFHVAAGGKGANQAVAAARMGAAVTMIGCIGDDHFGVLVRGELERAGVGVDDVRVERGAPTGTAHICVDARGHNTIVVASGANERLDPAGVTRAAPAWTGAALVVLQLEVPVATVAAAIHEANTRGLPVLLNAAPAQPLPGELLRTLAWLVVNEVEAAQLTGARIESPADAMRAAAMLRTGSQRVVITLGAAGAVLLGEAPPVHVPAPHLEALDTTAAGDAFVGALAAALVRGDAEEAAVRTAVIAGSLACTKLGAIPSLPTAVEVEAARAQVTT
jgi:ribokinase